MDASPADASVPPPAERSGWRPGAAVYAGLAVSLGAAAHGLAVAREWLYFRAESFHPLLAAGPLHGPYRGSILRHTLGYAVELLLLAALLAWGFRRRGVPWRRAAAEGVLHLLPLGLAPALLFVDDISTRLQLFASLVAVVAGAAVFRTLVFDDSRPPERQAPRVAAALCLLAAGFYITLAWLQHASYWSSLYDLGLFAGSLRSTVFGQGILFSPQFGCTFLAEHFSPILLLLAPLYRVFPDPMTLQVVQALSMAGAGWLVFVLARRLLEDSWAAVAVCFVWLILPETFQAQWHGFKMDLLIPPLLLGAVAALQAGSGRWFLLCVLLLWATKEDLVIYTAVLGLYAWWYHGRRLLGIGVAVASVVLGILLFGWVIPAYRIFQEDGAFLRSFPDQYKFARHFAHLGPDLPAALRGVVLNPLYVFGYALSEDRLASVLSLLTPLGFVALAGGFRSFLFLLPAGEMILSNFDYMYRLDFYYACGPVSFAFVAGLLGMQRLRERLAARPAWRAHRVPDRALAAGVAAGLAAALVLAHADPDSPLGPVWERPLYLRTPRTHAIDRALDLIPPEVPVTSTGYQAIHLMNRPRPALIPFGLDRARFLFIDLYRPAFPVKTPALVIFTRRILEDPAWGVRDWGPGFFLLERGWSREANAAARASVDAPDFEAEEWETSNFPNLGHIDPSASNGASLRITSDDRRGGGFLTYGQAYHLPPGRYRAVFRLDAEPEDRSWKVRVGAIDVFAGDAVLAARDVFFSDFAPPGWDELALEFTVTGAIQPLEFRVRYDDVGTLAVDVIRVRPLGR